MMLGWMRIGKIFILAVVLDVIYQIKVYHWWYPGETLAVAILLAIVPYIIVRGPINRIISWRRSKVSSRSSLKSHGRSICQSLPATLTNPKHYGSPNLLAGFGLITVSCGVASRARNTILAGSRCISQAETKRYGLSGPGIGHERGRGFYSAYDRP